MSSGWEGSRAFEKGCPAAYAKFGLVFTCDPTLPILISLLLKALPWRHLELVDINGLPSFDNRNAWSRGWLLTL